MTHPVASIVANKDACLVDSQVTPDRIQSGKFVKAADIARGSPKQAAAMGTKDYKGIVEGDNQTTRNYRIGFDHGDVFEETIRLPYHGISPGAIDGVVDRIMAEGRRSTTRNVGWITSSQVDDSRMTSAKTLIRPSTDFPAHHVPIQRFSIIGKDRCRVGLIATDSANGDHPQGARVLRHKIANRELKDIHLSITGTRVTAGIQHLGIGVCHKDKDIIGIAATVIIVGIVKAFDGRVVYAVQKKLRREK